MSRQELEEEEVVTHPFIADRVNWLPQPRVPTSASAASYSETSDFHTSSLL